MSEFDLTKAVQTKIAVEIVSKLSPEERDAIIGKAVADVLRKEQLLSWDVQKLLQAEGVRYAAEYIQRDDVQERIKAAAHNAVDTIMQNIVDIVGQEAASIIKSEYRKLYGKN